MKARISILTITAALAIAGSAVQPAGATIPWDAHSSALRTADRSLAVVTEAYSWRNYVHSYAGVRNVYRDALDRRDDRTLSRLADGYNAGAYVPGGAPLRVAKAIVAAGKIGSGDTRAVQSAKQAGFRYVR